MLLPDEWQNLKRGRDPDIVDRFYRYVHSGNPDGAPTGTDEPQLPVLLDPNTLNEFCILFSRDSKLAAWSDMKACILIKMAKLYQSLLPEGDTSNADFEVTGEKHNFRAGKKQPVYKIIPGSRAWQMLQIATQLTLPERDYVTRQMHIHPERDDLSMIDQAHEQAVAGTLKRIDSNALSYLRSALKTKFYDMLKAIEKTRDTVEPLSGLSPDGGEQDVDRRSALGFVYEYDNYSRILEAVMRIIDKAPVPMRPLLKLYYQTLHDRGGDPPSYKEMAEALNMKIGTVKSQLSRGEYFVANALRDEGWHPEEMGYTQDAFARS